MAELRQSPSMPSEVLDHAELMHLLLPIIRADAAVTETYSYRPGGPFRFPVTAFASEQDELIPRTAVEPWRNYTSTKFDLILVDGHHLFVQQQAPQIIRAIIEKLRGGT